jgi:hypothetical protein
VAHHVDLPLNDLLLFDTVSFVLLSRNDFPPLFFFFPTQISGVLLTDRHVLACPRESGQPPDKVLVDELNDLLPRCDLDIIDCELDGSRPDNEIQPSRIPTVGAN